MTLATHAAAGAAIAVILPASLPLVFFAAMASHYALDAIPHRDYDLNSFVEDENNSLNNDIVINRVFAFDLLKLTVDICLGLALALAVVFFIHPAGLLIVLAGVIGGMLPDGLQFIYMRSRSRFLSYFQRFHEFIHAKKELEVSVPAGLGLQAVVVALIFLVSYFWFMI